MGKVFILRIFVFVLLFFLALLYLLLVRKQEKGLRVRLSVACAGLLICIVGLGIGAYFNEVEIASKVGLSGMVLGFVGMVSTLRYRRKLD